jgi:hypothetical protein
MQLRYHAIQSQTDRDLLLQHVLDSVVKWLLSWQLGFNVSKSVLLKYHINVFLEIILIISTTNHAVKRVTSHIDLGVIYL